MGLSPSTNNPQGLADRIGKDSKLEVPASTQFVEKGSLFEVDEKGKGENKNAICKPNGSLSCWTRNV